MIEIPKGEYGWVGDFRNMRILPEKGTWFVLAASSGKNECAMICLDCERPFGLWNHTIADDGTVSPSVVCGYAKDKENPCGFHQFVKLLNYSPHA